eukprot:GGOE01002979.1.p1 GENE.GGOE01002979.1~~GGOE01002979.1.p1  ORF type:complete len:118 (+),score=1.12 GGOE01002979.1:448-801(+)
MWPSTLGGGEGGGEGEPRSEVGGALHQQQQDASVAPDDVRGGHVAEVTPQGAMSLGGKLISTGLDAITPRRAALLVFTILLVVLVEVDDDPGAVMEGLQVAEGQITPPEAKCKAPHL